MSPNFFPHSDEPRSSLQQQQQQGYVLNSQGSYTSYNNATGQMPDQSKQLPSHLYGIQQNQQNQTNQVQAQSHSQSQQQHTFHPHYSFNQSSHTPPQQQQQPQQSQPPQPQQQQQQHIPTQHTQHLMYFQQPSSFSVHQSFAQPVHVEYNFNITHPMDLPMHHRVKIITDTVNNHNHKHKHINHHQQRYQHKHQTVNNSLRRHNINNFMNQAHSFLH